MKTKEMRYKGGNLIENTGFNWRLTIGDCRLKKSRGNSFQCPSARHGGTIGNRQSTIVNRKSAITSGPSLELLAERQPLHLVRGADLDTVYFIGPREHGTIDESSHCLPMLDKNWHLMRPYFQYGQCSEHVAQSVSETRVEEACVVDTELSDGGS